MGGNSTRYAGMSTYNQVKSPSHNQPSASYHYPGSPHAAQHSSYSPTNLMVAFQTPSYSPTTPNYNQGIMPHTPTYNYGAPTSVGMPMYTMPNVSSPRHATKQASPLIQGNSAYGTSPNNPYGPGATTAYNPAYQTGRNAVQAQPTASNAPRNRANSESSDSDENK
jgi:hypothetical protein